MLELPNMEELSVTSPYYSVYPGKPESRYIGSCANGSFISWSQSFTSTSVGSLPSTSLISLIASWIVYGAFGRSWEKPNGSRGLNPACIPVISFASFRKSSTSIAVGLRPSMLVNSSTASSTTFWSTGFAR